MKLTLTWFQKGQRGLIWCQSSRMAALLLVAIHTRPEQRKLQNKSTCNNNSFPNQLGITLTVRS